MMHLNNKKFVLLYVLFMLFAFNQLSATSPILDSPADDETCVLIPATLAWNEVPASDSYHIQVATEPGFLNMVIDQLGYTEISLEVPLEDNTDYWWKVGSVEGGNTDWSSVWSFTTAVAPPDGLVPSPGTTCVPLATHFAWNTVTGANSYDLQVALDDLFSNLIVDQAALTNNEFDAALSAETNYFMRVRANQTGCTTRWSGTSIFTTTIVGTTLEAPADLTTYLGLKSTFTWEDTGDDFAIQIDDNADFSSPEIDVTDLTEAEYEAELTMYNTTYYWRVMAEGTSCNSSWSSAWEFTTVPAPPIGLFPYDSSHCLATDIEFFWDPAINTSGYVFHISTDNMFSDTVLYTAIADTFYLLEGMSNSTDYFWRVRGEDGNYVGDWTETFYFNTINSVTDLTAPADGVKGSDRIVTFEWANNGPNAKYVIFVSPDDSFTDTTEYEIDLTDTEIEFTFTAFDHYYFWKVGTYTDSCVVQWSEVWSFETLLAPPVLVSPDNESVGTTVSPLFTWEIVESANTYDFEMAYDAEFTELVESKGRFNIPATSLRVLNLDEESIYYWRVRSENEFAISPWSEPFMLTTGVDNARVPKLDFPTNNSVMVPIDITFSWLEADNADAYHIQVADNPQFDSPFTDVTDIPVFSYDVNGLMNYITYYWRVSAINAQGETGWSDVWEFRTIAEVPGDPVDLLGPNDGTENIKRKVDFKWLIAARAEFYYLQVSKSDGFDDIIFENENIVDLEKTIYSIEEDTQYFWRVRARNEAGEGPWSEVWSFRTWYWLGVDFEHESSMITITPNPVSDYLNISIGDNLTIDSWQIVDINGNLLLTGNSFVERVNVGSLANSTYYILINSGDRKFAQKFIINR